MLLHEINLNNLTANHTFKRIFKHTNVLVQELFLIIMSAFNEIICYTFVMCNTDCRFRSSFILIAVFKIRSHDDSSLLKRAVKFAG